MTTNKGRFLECRLGFMLRDYVAKLFDNFALILSSHGPMRFEGGKVSGGLCGSRALLPVLSSFLAKGTPIGFFC
jgi:hypothetical protein